MSFSTIIWHTRSCCHFARRDAELIYAGKVGGAHNREQWQINEMLVEKAQKGKVVARLKGGDPFIFGRGGEECEALVTAGIPFEVVPGVTAAIGAAAYAGIPLTHRDFTTSVSFVTGHESSGKEVSGIDWEQLSLGSGTLVFYMGMKNLPQIAANLIVHGRASQTPVALVRWGTRPEQDVLTGTLADIAEKAQKEGFKAPAVIIVGEVVRLRDKLRWFDTRPLFGKGILVTRATDQAGDFSRLLEGYGAHVLECPTIVVTPPESFEDLDGELRTLAAYDWLIFTSVNGVRFFFERLQALGFDSRAIGIVPGRRGRLEDRRGACGPRYPAGPASFRLSCGRYCQKVCRTECNRQEGPVSESRPGPRCNSQRTCRTGHGGCESRCLSNCRSRLHLPGGP